MTEMLRRIRNSLAYRLKWARFGVYYVRDLRIRSLRIAGKHVSISFPDREKSTLEYELGTILFHDCYRLATIKRPVRTILDIGANVGLFAISARYHFPDAEIHCYEPNPAILPNLRAHCAAIGAHVHPVAVSDADGTVSLAVSGDSLHTVAESSSTGSVRANSFAKIVSALGSVDLVKLDCEGGEWSIFRCTEAWSSVQSLVMEYHLWAKAGSSVDEVKTTLHSLGFQKVEIQESPNGPWGFAWAQRASQLPTDQTAKRPKPIRSGRLELSGKEKGLRCRSPLG